MMTELYKYKITSYIDFKKYEEKNEKIQLLRNKKIVYSFRNRIFK